MSAPFPPEAIFVPIAVTTRRAASTVPVPSVATPWPQMVAAVRVRGSRGNITLQHVDLFWWTQLHFFPTFADVDECLTGTHTCAENESCFNIQGGFRCLSFECPNNYRRVGETWVPWLLLFCTCVPGKLGRPDTSCTHQILWQQSCSFSQPDSDQPRDS